MKRILLIDGCDKVGKSTLLNDLVLAFPTATVFKNTIKPEGKDRLSIGKIAGIYLGAYQLANQTNGRTIFDRSHLTEIVYSHRRGYSSLDNIDWLGYEKMFLSAACVIYVSAKVETIKQRFITENETYIDITEIQNILERFDDYLQLTNLPVLQLSGEEERSRNVAKVIKFMTE